MTTRSARSRLPSSGAGYGSGSGGGGLNIIGTLIVLVLLAGAAFSAARGVSNLLQRLARQSVADDVERIRLELMRHVDCAATLEGIETDYECRPDRYLLLKGAGGKRLTGDMLLKKGAFRSSAPLRDRWHLRATCDTQAHALVVELARKGRLFGTFATDPENGQPLDWRGRLNPLIGPDVGLCAKELGGTSPTRRVMKEAGP